MNRKRNLIIGLIFITLGIGLKVLSKADGVEFLSGLAFGLGGALFFMGVFKKK